MENKIFNCVFCEYKTKRKFDLTRHQNAKHYKTNDIINERKNDIQNGKNDIYICIKCNKSYKTNKSYKQHIDKCKGINILTCPKCMKSFSTYSNKNKHIKKNNCKAKSIINLDNEYIKKEIIINGNIIINNNNIINNHFNERNDYLTLDDLIRILKSGNNIIPNYIEFKHFNKDFPENHNIIYKKNLGCIIKKDNKWSIINIDYLADNLFKNNSYELLEYYNKKKKEIDEKIKNIEIIEFIYSRLNYLDLSLNKDIFNKIKNEIKNKIRTLSIYI